MRPTRSELTAKRGVRTTAAVAAFEAIMWLDDGSEGEIYRYREIKEMDILRKVRARSK
jgi:hypothetical protein